MINLSITSLSLSVQHAASGLHKAKWFRSQAGITCCRRAGSWQSPGTPVAKTTHNRLGQTKIQDRTELESETDLLQRRLRHGIIFNFQLLSHAFDLAEKTREPHVFLRKGEFQFAAEILQNFHVVALICEETKQTKIE